MKNRIRLLSDPNITNVMPSEPTTQANSVTYDRHSIGSEWIYWTNGNGSKRMLLCKRSSAFTAADLPKDGNIYSGANINYSQAGVIGNARILYIGDGSYNYSNPLYITGLQRDTRHYWMVIEFNEGENGVPNYNINTATNNPKSWFTVP